MRVTGRSVFLATCLAAAALAATGCTALESEEWDVAVSVGELPPAPFGTRVDHSFVWTGAELFVWGGSSDGPHADGAAYSPDTDSWRVIADADLEARTRHTTAVLGDQRVLVWGGVTDTLSGNEDGRMARDGAIYDPGADSWEPIADAPEARYLAPVTVAGDHVVFGGGGHEGDLLVYSLQDDTWDSVPVTGAGERFRMFDLVAVDDEVVLAGASSDRMFTGRFRVGDTSASMDEFVDVEDPYGAYLGLAALPGDGALLAVDEGRDGHLYELDGPGRAATVHDAGAFQPPVYPVSYPLLSGEMAFVEGLGVLSTNAGEFSVWDADTGLTHWSGHEALDGYCGPVEPVGAELLIGWGGRCETGGVMIDLRA
ncbi:Kelch repeat-containing protein [Nocardiopsis terrae]